MADPLDDFLDKGFACDPNDGLKEAVRLRTTRVLRGRRRVRRLAIVGLAAACYLAGVATMWLLPPRLPVVADMAAKAVVIAENKIEPPPQEKPPERPEIYEFEAQTAPPGERYAQLRKAGDLYLEQAHDYASALRCYGQAFDAGGVQALAFSPDDNWLVMAIKNARKKEKDNE
jgi:hypothetical protein